MALRLRCGDGRDGSLEREPNRRSGLTLWRDFAGSGPLYRLRPIGRRNLPLLSAVLTGSSSPAITERAGALLERAERLEASLSDDARYRLLVESVTDYAIYMLDPSGVI